MKSKLSSPNLIFGLLIVIAACFIIAETVVNDITWDDSMIFYRYADNLVNGHGLVYNIGEYVEGYSSFLWTMLLALGGFLGFEISAVARWLGVLLAIGSVIIVFDLGRKFMPHTILAGALAVLLLAFRFDFGLYAYSGMETALITFLVTLSYFLYIKNIEMNLSLWAVGIITGLISIARPEGIIVAAAFSITELTRYKKENLKRLIIRLVSLAIPVIVIFGSFIIWRLSYYNDFFPNTYYVKISGLDPVYLARGVYHWFKFFIFGGGFVYFIPLLIFGLLNWKKIGTRAILALLLIFSAFTIYTTGDWFPFGRFMHPILPVLVAGVAAGIVIIKEKLQLNKLAVTLVVALFIFAGYQNALHREMEPTMEVFSHNLYVKYLSNLGRFLGEMHHEVPEMSVAAYPVGAIGYYSHARIIDMYGLTNHYIARNGVHLRGYVGHERTHAAYVLEQKPDIVYLGSEQRDSLGNMVPLFTEFNPMFINYQLPYSKEEVLETFLNNYEYVKLPKYIGFWCRKDSPCMEFCK